MNSQIKMALGGYSLPFFCQYIDIYKKRILMESNYDNALTLLEKKEIEKIKGMFVEDLSNLENLQKNKLITENEKLLLEVSLWSKVKYGLSKLGRYKAGGKIFGKSKTSKR